MQSTDDVSWELARVVVLAEHRKIDRSNVKYMSSAFELKGEFELECRLSSTTVGGTVNSHFTEYVSTSWKVIAFDFIGCQVINRQSTGLVCVETRKASCALLGVKVSDEPSEAAVLEESITDHVQADHEV